MKGKNIMKVINDKEETRLTLDDFEVGDGVYDLEDKKLYIVAQDLEVRVPGKLVDDADESDVYHCDDEDEDEDTDEDESVDEDNDDEDEDECDEDEKTFNHGYFLYDVNEANQVGRKHKTGPAAAIKSYFVNGVKHDFKRIPADEIELHYNA